MERVSYWKMHFVYVRVDCFAILEKLEIIANIFAKAISSS